MRSQGAITEEGKYTKGGSKAVETQARKLQTSRTNEGDREVQEILA